MIWKLFEPTWMIFITDVHSLIFIEYQTNVIYQALSTRICNESGSPAN